MSNRKYNYSGLRPFVFSDKHTCEMKIIKDLVIDCPFEFFSIEVQGGAPLTNNNFMPEYSGFHWLNDAKINVLCLMCMEVSPGIYYASGLFDIDHKGKKETIALWCEDELSKNAILSIAKVYLDKMKKLDIGTVKTLCKAKYRSPNGKIKEYKPKNVVYVGKRSNLQGCELAATVDWSHSWDVRGHWRRLKDSRSKGIDRKGNRTVDGFTWVKPFTKGNGVYIPKIRKVV